MPDSLRRPKTTPSSPGSRPEQKARLIVSARRSGRSVAFLGDGVNDALALHAADVGISVDTATDVAKDAADVVLLEKDLGVLAAGVAEGRRIFANTIKYVLMGTSSNFGNMFSAAAASAVLSFLPMLPSQILLNNLLYDSSQLAIPTDTVDAEQLHAPSHWNIAFIRRFMLTFGPISSLFDFLTFGLMLGVLHAGPVEFRTGWFVESLATQTLIIFAIRTRRVPFFRSRPSGVLTLTTLAVVAVGIVLTVSPVAHKLGFTTLPWQFYTALVVMTLAYLVLVEVTKKVFYAEPMHTTGQRQRTRGREHRIHRRAARFSHGDRIAQANTAVPLAGNLTRELMCSATLRGPVQDPSAEPFRRALTFPSTVTSRHTVTRIRRLWKQDVTRLSNIHCSSSLCPQALYGVLIPLAAPELSRLKSAKIAARVNYAATDGVLFGVIRVVDYSCFPIVAGFTFQASPRPTRREGDQKCRPKVLTGYTTHEVGSVAPEGHLHGQH